MQDLASTSRHDSRVHWVLVLVEQMVADWHVPLPDALFKEDIGAWLSLWPAMLLRHGCDPGLTHVDLARQRAKEKARQWIAERYTVLPSPPKKRPALRAAVPFPVAPQPAQ